MLTRGHTMLTWWHVLLPRRHLMAGWKLMTRRHLVTRGHLVSWRHLMPTRHLVSTRHAVLRLRATVALRHLSLGHPRTHWPLAWAH